MKDKLTITFITNIPAPYRHHLFNKLSEYYHNFTVIYSLFNELDRDWGNSLHNVKYKYIILNKNIRKNVRQLNLSLVRYILMVNRNHIFFIGSCGKWNKYFIIILSLVLKYKYIMVSDGAINNNLSKLKKYKKRIIYNNSSGILVPGIKGKYFFEELGIQPEKIYNSYLSPDLQYFRKFYENKKYFRDKIRNKLNIKKSDIVILTISRFLDWKRLEDLFEAIKMLEGEGDRYKKLVLLLIGNGTYDKPIKDILKIVKTIRIIWIKSIIYEKIPEYYASADFFVFPSEGDIWGLVINEALSMGLPVVCTEEIGASELIQNGINGFLVPKRRPDIIAKKIQCLFFSRKKRNIMSKNATEIYKKWNSELAVSNINNIIYNINKHPNKYYCL